MSANFVTLQQLAAADAEHETMLATEDVDDKNKNDKFPEHLLKIGPYQVLGAIIQTLSCFTSMNTVSYMSFGASTPTVSCHDQTTNTSKSNSQYGLGLMCELYQQANNGTCSNLTVSAPFHSIVQEWHLFCDMQSVHTITTIQMLAILVGAPTFGQLADRFGRKRVMLICWSLVLTIECVCSYSVNVLMFGLCRTALGFICAGLMASTFILYAESMDASKRFVMTSIGGWSLVFTCYGLLGWLTGGWRNLSFYPSVIMLPALLVLALLIEESPRWLLQRGRLEDAVCVMGKITKWNRIQADTASIRNQLQLHSSAQSEEPQHNYTIWHLFCTWRLTRYTIALALIWAVTSCVSYGILFSMSALTGNFFVNMSSFGIVRCVTNYVFLALSVLCPRVGRKPLLLSAVTVMMLCGVSILISTAWESGEWLARILHIAMGGFAAPIWALQALLAAELYPTAVRTLSHGCFSMMARLGGAFAAQVLILNTYFAHASYVCFLVLLAVQALVATLLIDEPRKQAMPEQMPPRSEWIFGQKKKCAPI